LWLLSITISQANSVKLSATWAYPPQGTRGLSYPLVGNTLAQTADPVVFFGHRIPAECALQVLGCGLLNQGVFGVVGG
jgi:hypothetical protein